MASGVVLSANKAAQGTRPKVDWRGFAMAQAKGAYAMPGRKQGRKRYQAHSALVGARSKWGFAK